MGRPRLLVPADNLACNRRIDWTAVFTHELAHAVRGDGWAKMWVEFITILLPLQPLVWVLRRSFRTTCEEASDDLAVAQGIDPVDLAEVLTAWINVHRQPTVLAAIGMSSSKARTLRLLALREKPAARLSRTWRWLGIPVAVVLMGCLAVAQTRNDNGHATKSTDQSETQSNSNDQPKSSTEPESKAMNGRPEEQQNATVAEDALIALYTRRLAEESGSLKEVQDELNAVKSGKKQASPKEQQGLEESVKKVSEWVEKYRTKLEQRTAELSKRSTVVPQKSTELANSKPQAPAAAPYTIEQPDVLEITPIRLISREPVRVEPLDKVILDVQNTKLDSPIKGPFKVDSSGEVTLGAGYGSVKISGLTRREAEEAVKTQLEATLAQPLVALTIDESRLELGIAGKHLVEPDGSINLGVYGTVKVDGQSVEEARKSVERQLTKWFTNPVVSVDVVSFNSKVFYVIVSASGRDNITRFVITGHETVLEAVAQIPGLTGLSEAKIWIDRPVTGGHQIIPIIWNEVLSAGRPAANPQILPGDRIFLSGVHQQVGLIPGGSYQPPTKIDGNTDESKTEPTPDLNFGSPVVIKTIPEAGSNDVDPSLTEISVTFSRDMHDKSWLWCHTSQESFPESTGDIHYLTDKRTCVMPVKLEPGKTYNIWLNWPKDEGENTPRNFKDQHGVSSVPYLLVFKTKAAN
jgi:polysaccharide biosynthesis/export protein